MLDGVTIADVKERVSVPEVLEALGLDQPAKVPGHICCPVHEDDTPSCYIQEDHWRCFGCGQGGDVFDLVQLVTGADLGNAILFLSGACDLEAAPRFEVRIPAKPDFTEEYDHSQDSVWESQREKAVAYWRARWPHLPDFWLNRFPAGVGRNSILVPHYDDEARIRGVKVRNISTGEKSAFKGSTFTSRLYRVVQPSEGQHPVAVICEGESDCWTLTNDYYSTQGWPIQVYALPSGAGTWNVMWEQELRGHDIVYLAMDHDEAGVKAAAKVGERLSLLEQTAWQVLPFPEEHNDITEAVLAGWKPPSL